MDARLEQWVRGLGSVRQIPLRRRDGTVRAYALVDDDLYDWLNQWTWHLHAKGYVVRNEWEVEANGHKVCRGYKMHRQVIGLDRGDQRQVDHENRNKLDNQRGNLRLADNAKQQQNRGVQRNSRSGVRGVGWQQGCWRANGWQAGGWRARAKLNGKDHFLGLYPTVEEAEAVVRAFRAEHMPFSEEARCRP